jgi:hypothetical protein
MDDDGGLAKAQTELAAKASAEAQRQQSDQDAVEAAKRDQASRLKTAISAFLERVSADGIPSEQFVVDRRQTGLRPRARFGRDQRGVWGFHSRPIPSEPIYEGRYTLYAYRHFGDVNDREQKIFLRQTGRLELQDIQPRRKTSLWEKVDKPVPFYIGHNEKVEHGEYPAYADARGRIDSIQETTDWLVQLLAAYLLAHKSG